jgi:hypothetical protein
LFREQSRAALKSGFFPFTRLLFEAMQVLATPTEMRMVSRGVPQSFSTDEYVEMILLGFVLGVVVEGTCVE